MPTGKMGYENGPINDILSESEPNVIAGIFILNIVFLQCITTLGVYMIRLN